jgi:2-polyprenyl-3-methyl-5-hydroxy-6-metoxy-1,4-benzoquinol methylase
MRNCRLCGGDLDIVLDLGLMPLANRYRRASELMIEEPTYPLQFARCKACRHAQLTETVSPDSLFTDRPYLFHAGASLQWRKHCAHLATAMPEGKGRLAIDIGSNDGTLLHHLHARGYWVMGVEPSTELNALHPYASLPQYWNHDTADWIIERVGARPHLITATNVFAHVDDPVAFLLACKRVLVDDGHLVIESPSLESMLVSNTFDQVYHEHIHYWHPHAVVDAAWRAGMAVVKIDPVLVHGGSVRYTLVPHRKRSLWTNAPGLRDFHHFRDRAMTWMEDWREKLETWRDDYQVVWGYGASAKGMILLNAVPVHEAVTRIIDDNPAKQGWYCPGQPVPITEPGGWETPDVVILFAWNWAKEMAPRLRSMGFRGEIVNPFPDAVIA